MTRSSRLRYFYLTYPEGIRLKRVVSEHTLTTYVWRGGGWVRSAQWRNLPPSVQAIAVAKMIQAGWQES